MSDPISIPSVSVGAEAESTIWLLVPLPVIDEAIQKLKEGTIGDFRYDPESARLVPS